MANILSEYDNYILEKINRVRPECGEDNSKERYRYMQWLSCKNAVLEAMRDFKEEKNGTGKDC